jgi:hypothetical protein
LKGIGATLGQIACPVRGKNQSSLPLVRALFLVYRSALRA